MCFRIKRQVRICQNLVITGHNIMKQKLRGINQPACCAGFEIFACLTGATATRLRPERFAV